MASARRGPPGPMKQGLGPGSQHLGRRRTRQQVPHHHQSRWQRGSRNRHARIWAPAPAPSSPWWPRKRWACRSSAITLRHRRQQLSARRRFRRFHHDRRRFGVHPQIHRERAARNCSSGGAGAGRRAGPARRRWTAHPGRRTIPSKSLTWKAACPKLGVNKISEMGENNPRKPGGLNTGGVGGVQMADVSVDTETGIVKMNKFVAVQDCGLIINPKLAESQVHGAAIMGICAALYRRARHGSADRPHAERRYGILQAGRHRRYRRDRGAHGHSRRRTTNAASSAWASRRRSA